jgi:hypothetical protein
MMPRLGAAAVALTEVGAATVAARSRFEDHEGAALSQCVAQAIEAVIAATGIGATASVRQRWAQPLLALLRTAAAATTHTATGFAPINSAAMSTHCPGFISKLAVA